MSGAARIWQAVPMGYWRRCKNHGKVDIRQVAKRKGVEVCAKKPGNGLGGNSIKPICGTPIEQVSRL